MLRQYTEPITYISRALKKAELHYSVTEKELLAAILAMEKFEHFLLGKKFILINDHEAMKFINDKKEFGSQKISRWHDRIQRFTFDVRYREGEENVVPYILSRYVELNTIEDYDAKEILRLHKLYCHRNNIKYELEKNNIHISRKNLRRIVNLCEDCISHYVNV